MVSGLVAAQQDAASRIREQTTQVDIQSCREARVEFGLGEY